MQGKRHILITGGAGFIGSSISARLLETGCSVTIVDNLDPYYSPAVKRSNIEGFLADPDFTFYNADILHDETWARLKDIRFDALIHLAARVGVRPSMDDPAGYNSVNAGGTLKALCFAEAAKIPRFILASSSSVYGLSEKIPWSEDLVNDSMVSPYAVSKKAAELYAGAFTRFTEMRVCVLRLFTVYGPGQRPDLAIHRFAKAIHDGRPLHVYGDGSMLRDYTYIGDVVDAFMKALSYNGSTFDIFNIGNNKPVNLTTLISELEKVFQCRADVRFIETQAGDVPLTCADITKSARLLGYEPSTSLTEGLGEFKKWLTGHLYED